MKQYIKQLQHQHSARRKAAYFALITQNEKPTVAEMIQQLREEEEKRNEEKQILL